MPGEAQPPVIPAEAGIYTERAETMAGLGDTWCLWIPAYARMTEGDARMTEGDARMTEGAGG
jgi:hypothetical protein